MARLSRIRRAPALIAFLVLLGLVPTTAMAAPSDRGCDNRRLTTASQLLACVGADDTFEHLEAFQAIADANGGTRASGTPGYDASVDYVATLMEEAGYEVTIQPFDFFYYEEDSTVTLDGTTLQPFDIATGEGTYDVMTYSGDGVVSTDTIVPVNDLVVPIGDSPPNASTAGCEASDFDPAPAEDAIALVQRGTCSFAQKALNAQDAGYDAVLVFNEGQPGRDDVLLGTLGEENFGVVTIPVLGLSYDRGVELLETGGDFTIEVNVTAEERETSNVIAELEGANADNVVMAGAHLDSVVEGPGINDNGSGSAALLTIASALADTAPENTLRFAWWGAEEAGLLGSEHYIASLSQAELDEIAAYLNFDMVGSPNFIYGVYDADESSFEAPVVVPEGSAAIEDLFEQYYSVHDIPYEDSEFSGRSDYQAFIDVGIPAGGLFTGAEVEKTEEQADLWGGTAGIAYDPCYHAECDTLDNVSLEAMDVNVDAIAYALFHLASSTETVNGVAGERVPGPKPSKIQIDGPAGTVGLPGSGLDHDHSGAAA